MKLRSYLLGQLSSTFFPIFLGLYFITSIIFLVKIAALTSIITIDIVELLQLYLYATPTIIFYTAPISFFISLVITLTKLSNEYELIVITSFGLNPLKIMRIFFPVTLLLSISLLVLSIGLIPKAKYLNEVFLNQKKKEANFNIKASEFGQKFGDWLIYISNKEDKTYSDIKLFKTDGKQDEFIMSEKATLENYQGELSFKLYEGNSFNISENELNQIKYKTMQINDSISGDSGSLFTNSFIYWNDLLKNNREKDKFTFFILTSIFPLISLFLVITFGYFNPRYEKNSAISYSLIAVVIYYILMKLSTDNIFLHSLYVVPLLWISGTYYLYKKRIKPQY